ncbi:MAG: hypothetical protein M3H12_02410 [Chromatiales bacterium]|nr:hypothetical protein [Gammaproteobacteria bacterium]
MNLTTLMATTTVRPVNLLGEVRHNPLTRVHNDIQDWAAWWTRTLTQSSIGYPGETAPEKYRRDGGVWAQGGDPSRSPGVIVPKRLSYVELAVRCMPEPIRVVLEYKYLKAGYRTERERQQAYCERYGCGKNRWDVLVIGLHWFVLAYDVAANNGPYGESERACAPPSCRSLENA